MNVATVAANSGIEAVINKLDSEAEAIARASECGWSCRRPQAAALCELSGLGSVSLREASICLTTIRCNLSAFFYGVMLHIPFAFQTQFL